MNVVRKLNFSKTLPSLTLFIAGGWMMLLLLLLFFLDDDDGLISLRSLLTILVNNFLI